MDSFFRTHAFLVQHLNAPVRRDLMDEINWNHRLIGIKGTRGVGKTTFLLQYAKEKFNPDDRSCLYINTNNFYVQEIGIRQFAAEFYNQGGRVLLIDQVFKLPDWSRQLRDCYDRFPQLKIVFTGSSVMRLKEENPELYGIVHSYNLRGFSFREYLNLMTRNDFPSYSLSDIEKNHVEIAKEITSKVEPRKYFDHYLHHGFYPFFLEKRDFSENLLKTMNMMIEVDILLLKQIELKYLAKIKKLFYLLTCNGTSVPNVSKLAQTLNISRATVMNYIKYLAEARLVNIIYNVGEEFPKKPGRIQLHNPNLLYSFYPQNFDKHDVWDAFFCNTMWKDHQLSKDGSKNGAFIVDEKKRYKVVEHPSKLKNGVDVYFATYNCDVGSKNQIPLWLLGFLY